VLPCAKFGTDVINTSKLQAVKQVPPLFGLYPVVYAQAPHHLLAHYTCMIALCQSVY